MNRALHTPLRRLVVATLFALALSSSAAAQTVRVTSAGNASLSGNVGGGITVQTPSNNALATVVNFGEVGPANTSNYVCFVQPLALRADAAISLRLAVTASSFGAAATALRKSDIGLGLTNLADGGPLASIATTSITPAFATDPCSAAKNIDGVPNFSATLNSVATAAPGTTVLQSTGAISALPNLNLTVNRVLVSLRMAIAPQLYAAGSFSATVTVTITNP